jgi:starvation-inducible DNA-binding protein
MDSHTYPVFAPVQYIGQMGSLPLGSAKVARGLSHLYALTQTLCRQSLYCHWQAEEPDFPGLHSLFEQHYQSLRKAADVIAERIHVMGYSNLLSAQADSVWGTGTDDARSPVEMFDRMILSHQACTRQAKDVMDTADMTGDDQSAHLGAQRLEAHERAVWLLRALTPDAAATHSAA